MKPSNVYIETYGCQMNKLDSENAAAILEKEGFNTVQDITLADVILLNTCGVRENAEIRIHGRVAELSSLKKERPEIIFGIIGCMAQRLERSLLSDTVKIVAGPDSYRKLPGMVQNAMSEYVVDTALDASETYADIKAVRCDPFSAWIAVMRGCNNYCTYCIVPYVRGRERSIPVHLLIAEINRLKHKGYREVTLLGQNVNSYSNDDVDFALLLDRIAETGIEWIRFLTSHPVDLNERILEVMARRKNVCRHLHLPLQSGSDRILASMNRRYTTADYLTLVEKARHIVDGISLSTDFIFGFPGETEEDYQKSLSVINTVEFDYAFLYRYSERNGTKACGLEGSVPEKIRLERLKEAIERQRAISYKLNRKRIGEVHKVLVKEISKDGEGLFGLAEKNIPVVINGKTDGIKFGSFVDVRIESTTGSSLIGIVE